VADNPTDPLCGLFKRSEAGPIRDVHDGYFNVAEQSNKGLDFALQWIRDIGPGSFKLAIFVPGRFCKQGGDGFLLAGVLPIDRPDNLYCPASST